MFTLICGIRGSSKRCNVISTQLNPILYFTTSTQSNYVLNEFQDRKNIAYHAPRETELCTRKLSSGNTAPVFPPFPALILGVGGAIPFLFPPLYMMNSGVFCSTMEFSHLAYGASIISFIGGVRWGLTLTPGSTEKPNWRNLTYSVIPSLLGWSGLLAGAPYGYVPVTMGLLATCLIDLSWSGYPKWYKALRILLTLLAGSSFVLIAKLRYEEELRKEEEKEEEE